MLYQDGFIYILVKVGDVGEEGTFVPIMSIAREVDISYSSVVAAVEEKVSLFKNRKPTNGKLRFEMDFRIREGDGVSGAKFEGRFRTDTEVSERHLVRILSSQIAEEIDNFAANVINLFVEKLTASVTNLEMLNKQRSLIKERIRSGTNES